MVFEDERAVAGGAGAGAGGDTTGAGASTGAGDGAGLGEAMCGAGDATRDGVAPATPAAAAFCACFFFS